LFANDTLTSAFLQISRTSGLGVVLASLTGASAAPAAAVFVVGRKGGEGEAGVSASERE